MLLSPLLPPCCKNPQYHTLSMLLFLLLSWLLKWRKLLFCNYYICYLIYLDCCAEALQQRLAWGTPYKGSLTNQYFRVKTSLCKDLLLKSQALPSAFGSLLKFLTQLLAYINTRSLGHVTSAGEKAGPWFVAVTNYITTSDFRSILDLLEEIVYLQVVDQSRWQKLLGMPGKKLPPPIVIIREIQRLDNLKMI